MSGPPGISEPTVRLSVPEAGIVDGDLMLRPVGSDDVEAMLPAFTDPELREAANLPNFGRDELLPGE